MKTLRETLQEAEEKKVAIGHFNISNIEGLWGIFNAARELEVPVIIGVSEGERKFFGLKQAVAVVQSLRQEFDYPIYINADHTYTFEAVKEAVDAGCDAVIFDGAKLSFEENLATTKKCVEYATSMDPEIIVEAELGYIGTSSKMLDEIPEGAGASEELLTKPEEAERFVKESGVDLFAPAVGNLHGMLKGIPNPKLNINRIREIRESAGVPLVLHGGSGIADEDFTEAIKAGMNIVHINTEIRVAFRDAVKKSLAETPDEVAPYKFMKGSVEAVQEVVSRRLKLYNRM